MLSQELPHHVKASPIRVGVSLHTGVSLCSWVLHKHHDCSHAASSSMAWALSLSFSLPELMEILYTWSWPLPKDTPALQRKPLLTAPCSAHGCSGGDRGRKEPEVIQQAAGHGEEPLRVLLGASWSKPPPTFQRGSFQYDLARRTPGLTHHFRHEVPKQ